MFLVNTFNLACRNDGFGIHGSNPMIDLILRSCSGVGGRGANHVEPYEMIASDKKDVSPLGKLQNSVNQPHPCETNTGDYKTSATGQDIATDLN